MTTPLSSSAWMAVSMVRMPCARRSASCSRAGRACPVGSGSATAGVFTSISSGGDATLLVGALQELLRDHAAQ